MKASRAALGLVAALLVGCGKDSNGPPGALTGDWEGASGSETYSMTLNHSGSHVSGTGLIYNASNSATLAISGTAGSQVHLTMTPDQAYQPFTFTGTLTSANELSGVFNGSGFSNFSAIFTRVP